MDKKIVIIGAGPCGLGAGFRLKELGYHNFCIFEKNGYPGGLAASFQDKKGFTWDIGGHVLFSHYKYFDSVMNKILKKDSLYHEREAWVWVKGRFVPYPFQNNIRYLPKRFLWECLEGLLKAAGSEKEQSVNFQEWVKNTLGSGIARIFMLPYNFKVWAYPLKDMMSEWIAERVSVPDLKRILRNIIYERDDISWGPNNRFRFPLKGGTGAIWRSLASIIGKDKIFYRMELSSINTEKKLLVFKDGSQETYDILINTMPLDAFIKYSELKNYQKYIKYLRHTSVYVVGLVLKGQLPEKLRTKCWMYFPEDTSPFYRVTVFSNYSPHNVPDSSQYWSLMAEISSSRFKPIDENKVVERVIEGVRNTHLIRKKRDIVDTWKYYVEYGYPVPSLKRERSLKELLPELMKKSIYSRGRFGVWRYEVGNMDHCVMQGVEVVNKLILGEPETI